MTRSTTQAEGFAPRFDLRSAGKAQQYARSNRKCATEFGHELDFIHPMWDIDVWAVDATEEYLHWFSAQAPEVQEAVLAKVYLVEEFGPQLGRPHADTLKGSRKSNLKELRARTGPHVLRVIYFFDEGRRGLLLIGRDKKGKNEKHFYRKLIADAEALIHRLGS